MCNSNEANRIIKPLALFVLLDYKMKDIELFTAASSGANPEPRPPRLVRATESTLAEKRKREHRLSKRPAANAAPEGAADAVMEPAAPAEEEEAAAPMAVEEEEHAAVPMAPAALGAPLAPAAPEDGVAPAAPEAAAVPAGAVHGCGKRRWAVKGCAQCRRWAASGHRGYCYGLDGAALRGPAA